MLIKWQIVHKVGKAMNLLMELHDLVQDNENFLLVHQLSQNENSIIIYILSTSLFFVP